MGLLLPLRPRLHFEKLLRPHIPYLYRLAWRFTGNRADAEDLVQDLLTKLYPRACELAAIEQLGPWLARVLHRQYIDFWRKRERSPLSDCAGGEDDEDALESLPAAEADPAERIERTQQLERIERALRQLNVEQRAVIALHDIEGYTLEELEAILETPLGTLKSRLHRARARLRELLAVEPFPLAQRVSG